VRSFQTLQQLPCTISIKRRAESYQVCNGRRPLAGQKVRATWDHKASTCRNRVCCMQSRRIVHAQRNGNPTLRPSRRALRAENIGRDHQYLTGGRSERRRQAREAGPKYQHAIKLQMLHVFSHESISKQQRDLAYYASDEFHVDMIARLH
jgi:hypothetical protein